MDDPLQPWIDRLIDGETPDWAALEREFGIDSPLLARMRKTARLCAALHVMHPCRAARSAAAEAAAGHAETASSGFVWGHLRVLGEIGRGSSGTVHRAFDPVLQREIALKLRHAASLQARAFIAEARRLAQVRHASVLAVHGAAVHEGRAGLWSDLVDGASLADWVARQGPCTPAQIVPIASALASALDAVHAAGLVHGDVKPANAMRENDTGRIVLMDFGSAAEHVPGGLSGLLGSPVSMAPEQWRGEPIGTAADLYGLGVILFHLASGRYPPAANGPPDAAARAAAALALPRELRRLLRELLHPVARHRPAAAAVVQRLEWIARAPVRRRRQVGWITVMAALTIGLGVALWQAQLARHEAARAGLVKDFLIGLFELGDPDRSGEGRVDAGTLLRLGADRALGEFSGDPELRIDLARSIAQLAGKLGDYAQGIAAIDALLADAAVAALLQHVDRAGLLIDRGSLHARAGQPALARTDLDAARAWLLADGRAQPAQQSRLLLAEAWVGQSAGEFALARSAIEQALQLDLQREGPQGPDVARDRYALADLEHAAGNRDLARAIWRELLAGERQRLGDRHTRIADIQHNLGVVAVELGDREAAEAHFLHAAELRESMLGSKHPLLARTLRDWGGNKRLHGDLDGAEALYRRALQIIEGSLGPAHPEAGRTYNSLGVLLVGRGDLQAAREALLQARAITQASEPQSPMLAALELNLASVELRLGNWGPAQTGFDSALQRILALYGENHPLTAAALTGHYRLAWLAGADRQALEHLLRAEAIHDRVYDGEHLDRWAVATGKARALMRLGRHDEASALAKGLQARVGQTLPAEHPLLQDLAMVRAQLELAAGDAAAAARRLQPVIELRHAGRERYPFGFAEAALTLAEIRQAVGQHEAARILLAEAEAAFAAERLPQAMRRQRDAVTARLP